MSVVRMSQDAAGRDVVSCRLLADDWEGYRVDVAVAVPHPRGRRRRACPSAYPPSPRRKWRRAAAGGPLVRRRPAPVAPAADPAHERPRHSRPWWARAWLALLAVGAVLAGLDAVAGAGLPVRGGSRLPAGGLARRRPPGRPDPAQSPTTVRPWLVMAAGLACLVARRRARCSPGRPPPRRPRAGRRRHRPPARPIRCWPWRLLLLAHDRRPGDRAGRIEAWIVSAGAALVFVELLIRPTLDAGPGIDGRHPGECRLPGR